MSISVIIPCYRAAATLRRAVDSALTGAPADLEVLLVDDGSPDDTGALCDELAAARPARRGRCHRRKVAAAGAARKYRAGRRARRRGCCFWMPTMRFYPVCGPRWMP